MKEKRWFFLKNLQELSLKPENHQFIIAWLSCITLDKHIHTHTDNYDEDDNERSMNYIKWYAKHIILFNVYKKSINA